MCLHKSIEDRGLLMLTDATKILKIKWSLTADKKDGRSRIYDWTEIYSVVDQNMPVRGIASMVVGYRAY